MPTLSTIVYRSRAVGPVTDVDLFYLLAQARDLNAAVGVTGILIYDRGHFFQWIEGANGKLGPLWNRIRNDQRHRDVEVLADQAIPSRLFHEWSMRFAHRDRQYEAMVDSFVAAEPFVLDDLHLNPSKTASILASFSRLKGGEVSAPARA